MVISLEYVGGGANIKTDYFNFNSRDSSFSLLDFLLVVSCNAFP